MTIPSPCEALTSQINAAVPHIVTRLGGSSVSIVRHRPRSIGEGDLISVAAEDAYVIIYQLVDHPRHDTWLGGRFTPAGPAPRGTLNIVHLGEGLSARLLAPFDSLIFHIPLASLNELADRERLPPVSALRTPSEEAIGDPLLRDLQDSLLHMLDRPDGTSRLLRDHLVMGLHAHFAERYGGLGTGQPHRPGGLASWQERRAKELIASNLAKDLTLAEVAAECRLSPAHFARAFKASTGSTPHGWLQARRIERAKELLAKQNLALAEVALACGYADQSHLTRTFGARVGMSPGVWRRTYSRA
ncbi:AraC family transcriptional regulator [Enterovirga aerilata]|uniref:Helix-turn-helix transcriptional regulator n=1 Tax=Enterovirga aerilata TaxID=2730920 RepID=A0A849I5E1_9HYPH|nr:AraC family transcriptional regulator [Enterovirga sp. DB1703]NNM71619.1 helix-turn-helix transcriptional regulator [Enterovirga sp. DB1703]